MSEMHTDGAIESAEHMRGKRGGPRAKYFFCAAIKGKAIVHKAVPAMTEDQASQIFIELFGLPPQVIDCGQDMKEHGGGYGYFLSKGTGISDAQRISVTISASQLRSTSTHYRAKFKGWIVYGNGIKSCKIGDETFADDELVTILFDSLADPNNKIPKPKLKKNEVVRMSDFGDDVEILPED
jgi:hypothetical protein